MSRCHLHATYLMPTTFTLHSLKPGRRYVGFYSRFRHTYCLLLFLRWSFLPLPFPFILYLSFHTCCLYISLPFVRYLSLFLSRTIYLFVCVFCCLYVTSEMQYQNWAMFVSHTGTRTEGRTHGLEKCLVSSYIRSLRTKPSTPNQW